MGYNEILETLKLIQQGSTEFTLQQRKATEVLYRRALVTRDVGTGEYHVNDRGEKLMKYLEGQK